MLSARRGAGLYLGFKKPVTKQEYAALIAENRRSALCFVPAQAGDSFFLPAGLVHAIGGGLLIAEIQQSSDATYRVYDWGRLGLDGKPRPLHIGKALDVSDTSAKGGVEKSIKIPESFDTREYMAACPLFASMRIEANGHLAEHTKKSSFHIIFISEGCAKVHTGEDETVLEKGQTAVLPAGIGSYGMSGSFTAYRFWIPDFEDDYVKPLLSAGIPERDIYSLYRDIKG